MLMLYYQERVSTILRALSSTERGLNDAEAAQRLQRYGPNAIRVPGEPWWVKVVEPFRSVFMVVLMMAAAVSFWNGEPLDASIILATLGVSVGIYYAQRFST